ncbi:MAG: 3-hydroxyisobutyrate dehydrogenase [Gammaproteobacteria bacterium]
MKQISFIGLGHMGNPMVKNLLRAGFSVKVFDLATEAIQALVSQGATATSSIKEAASEADIIITMLQTGQQVKAVCFGENGLFAHAKKDILYIDSSSIEITATNELHKAAENQGIAMLDAPVSGGVAGAEAATLTFMVGGSETNFQRGLPLFEKMGKKIVHAGLAGSGQAAKICNNLILGISMIAVSEGFSLGKKLGLDPKKFFEISSNASGQCWSMTSYCPVPGLVEKAPSNNDFKPGFTAKMMLKDLRLGQLAAESVNAAIPLGAEAAELYTLFVNQGKGELDFSAIITLLNGAGVST